MFLNAALAIHVTARIQLN